VLIRPDDIDDRTIPIPASHAAFVKIDDGGLVVDEEAGRGFGLNATASLLWTLFDSVSPLGELIDDVSTVFGAPRDQVADSVHGLARFFGEMGFFSNVARSMASLPVDVEYVDLDECGEPIPPEAKGDFVDAPYVAAPPNA
jgi:hypothetical protein